MESTETKEKISDEFKIEIKIVSNQHSEWVRNICKENGCKILSEEWRSKYNKHVIYDYEPFCSDGFDIVFTIASSNNNYLKFVEYLYNKRLSIEEGLNFSFTYSPKFPEECDKNGYISIRRILWQAGKNGQMRQKNI